MTFSDIKRSPEVRARLDATLKTPEGQIILRAIEEEILNRMAQGPESLVKQGDSLEASIARWNSKNLWVNGWGNLLKILRGIGDAPPVAEAGPVRPEYAHAIPPHLQNIQFTNPSISIP